MEIKANGEVYNEMQRPAVLAWHTVTCEGRDDLMKLLRCSTHLSSRAHRYAMSLRADASTVSSEGEACRIPRQVRSTARLKCKAA